MKNFEWYVGHLTQDEIKELLDILVSAMLSQDLMEGLDTSLHPDVKAELGERWLVA